MTEALRSTSVEVTTKNRAGEAVQFVVRWTLGATVGWTVVCVGGLLSNGEAERTSPTLQQALDVLYNEVLIVTTEGA